MVGCVAELVEGCPECWGMALSGIDGFGRCLVFALT